MSDDVSLLHELFTSRKSFADFDQANSRPDPGIELRYDGDDGEMLYLQLRPFALQAYDENGDMADAGWDEIRELVEEDERQYDLDVDLLSFFMEARRE